MHVIRSDVEPVDPNLVPLIISEIDIEQYTQVAILTLLVYDTGKLRIRVLAWETSYLGFECCFFFHTASHIRLLYYSLLWLTLNSFYRYKRLAACLRALFGLEAAFDLCILIYQTIYEEIAVGELAKGVTFCGANRSSPEVWGALTWLVLMAAPMLYEIVLMILALYKARKYWRETAGFSQFTLVKVLIQDQAIYFIMCTSSCMANQLSISNVLLSYLLDALGNPSLLCVLGSHLLTNLKEAGERGANGGTSYRMKTTSSIEFS
ncbi:hypothetical protein DFH11DRAFT_1515033 [Phellopilus nigrolimitatus]|nr:hypothetical protein DFH11DRAFT_1515033 [Phellopilus nigrolimitatus]